MKQTPPFFTRFSILIPVILILAGTARAQATLPHLVDGWQPEAPREELMPSFVTSSPRLFNGKPVLEISSSGKGSSNGWWARSVPVSPGKYYSFRTHFLAMIISKEEYRSVLARVIWRDREGKQAALPEYPATRPETDKAGWSVIEGIYQAPLNAVSARLELVFRWSPGQVFFRDTSFVETAPPEPREVTIATVHFRPAISSSARENLEKFSEFVVEAKNRGADIVCLPEGITLVGTGNNYLESSEPVPGPTTEFMGDIASSNQVYLVANIYEKENEALYNTSVLLDRQGKIAGKYRKVSLPREEIDGGLSPGNSFDVFDTDFGRIGLMTCWDVFFPVPARTLAMKGAEIIFLPIWGGDLNLAEARAIENQVYLVSSSYDMKTAVFNHEGKIIAEGTEENPVAIVKIDLKERTLWPWLGDFKSRIRREKPPVASGREETRAVMPSREP